MTKIIKGLVAKRYVHRPARTTVAVANEQYLILYWAFRRDLGDDIQVVWETSMDANNLEREVALRHPRAAFTAFTAARLFGVQESPYSGVYCYDFSGSLEDLRLPRGRNSKLFVLGVDDAHLESKSVLKGQLRVVPLKQSYVDLLSIGTWEAKYAAMSLSKVDPSLPLIGSRVEMEEYL